MNGVMALVAATVLAIDVGWQPLPDGGFEYIIQIPPQTLDSMKNGQDLASQLPPLLQGVRNYRITVGTAKLPHEGEPPPVTPPAALPAATTMPADSGPAFPTGRVAGTPPTSTTTANGTGGDSASAGDAGGTEQPRLDAESDVQDITKRTAGYLQGPPAALSDPRYNQTPPPPTSPPPSTVPPNNYTFPGTPPSIRSPAPSSAIPNNAAVPSSAGAPNNSAIPNSPAMDHLSLPPPPDANVPEAPSRAMTPVDSAPPRYTPPPTDVTPPDAIPRYTPPPEAETPREPPLPRETPIRETMPRDTSARGASTRDYPIRDPQPRDTSTKDIGTKESPPKDNVSSKDSSSNKETSSAKDEGAKATPVESRPWLPLMGSVLALFASLGTNVYLGWNTLDLRSKYRSLAEQLHAE